MTVLLRINKKYNFLLHLLAETAADGVVDEAVVCGADVCGAPVGTA